MFERFNAKPLPITESDSLREAGTDSGIGFSGSNHFSESILPISTTNDVVNRVHVHSTHNVTIVQNQTKLQARQLPQLSIA